MPSGHEIGEEIEHAGHSNRTIALLIAVLALFLAFATMGAKSTQTEAITENLTSANLWMFFQSTTIRRTTIESEAELTELRLEAAANSDTKAAKLVQIAAWKKQAKRLDSDEAKVGRRSFQNLAKTAEEKRDKALSRYHHYEVASAAFEVGIVLASATVITGLALLAWLAGGLGVVGLGFMGIALFAPDAVHLF
jgi:hypothetical protein